MSEKKSTYDEFVGAMTPKQRIEFEEEYKKLEEEEKKLKKKESNEQRGNIHNSRKTNTTEKSR